MALSPRDCPFPMQMLRAFQHLPDTGQALVPSLSFFLRLENSYTCRKHRLIL